MWQSEHIEPVDVGTGYEHYAITALKCPACPATVRVTYLMPPEWSPEEDAAADDSDTSMDTSWEEMASSTEYQYNDKKSGNR